MEFDFDSTVIILASLHVIHYIFFSDKIIAKCQAQLFIKFGTNPTKTSDGFVLKLLPLLETDFLKEFSSRFSCNV